MKWLLIGLAIVALVVVAVLVIGLCAPRSHAARTRARYRQTPDALWHAIADVEAWPSWNRAVARVERRPPADGKEAWVVTGEWGSMTTVVEASEPARLHRTRAADANGTFEGSWTYEIAPCDGGAELTVTERGSVSNPVFRFFMLFHDNHSTMEGFHRALASKFGESVEVARIPLAASEARRAAS